MAQVTLTLSPSAALLPTVEYPPSPSFEQELAKALEDTTEPRPCHKTRKRH